MLSFHSEIAVVLKCDLFLIDSSNCKIRPKTISLFKKKSFVLRAFQQKVCIYKFIFRPSNKNWSASGQTPIFNLKTFFIILSRIALKWRLQTMEYWPVCFCIFSSCYCFILLLSLYAHINITHKTALISILRYFHSSILNTFNMSHLNIIPLNFLIALDNSWWANNDPLTLKCEFWKCVFWKCESWKRCANLM